MAAVTRLTLTRFRNYRSARIEVGPQPVVLSGANGAGKTNLLEALSFLSPGRGLRRARLSEVTCGASGLPLPEPDSEPDSASGAPKGWAVAASVCGASRGGGIDIGTGWEPAAAAGERGAGRERRLLRLDGQPARSQTLLAEHLTVLWLTPQMDRLFVEGAGGRRRFLDRLVFGFDPGHAGRLNRYEHALRERSRLLREGARDRSWLGALEDLMATTGVAVAVARKEVAARLNRACAASIGPFPRAELSVTGSLESWLDERPALLVEDRLRSRLKEQRAADAESGSAAIGPHRSDVLVSYRPGDAGIGTGVGTAAGAGNGARAVPADGCSTGEQKALLLAIVLANARLLADLSTGPPLLLLDEVAAHLDASRRAALFDEILALGTQAWLTGTDTSLFTPLHGRAQLLTVTAGHTEPASLG